MEKRLAELRKKVEEIQKSADRFCETMKEKYPDIWWCSGNDDDSRAIFYICKWNESEEAKPIWKMNIDGYVSVICDNIPYGSYICYKSIEELGINVDKCLVTEIKSLNEQGIKTVGCCCGHGKSQGYIQVQQGYGKKMEALGYEKLPIDESGNGHNCFKPKSNKEARLCVFGKFKGTKIRDISGRRFGKLLAIEPTSKRYKRSVVWKCICDCGNEIELPVGSLINGLTTSCGCIKGGWKNRKHFGCMECGSDKHYAGGLCKNCYNRKKYREKKEVVE